VPKTLRLRGTIGEIETGIVLVAGDQAVATEEICAGLETGDLTVSAWIGECLVMVINLLAEYPAPDRKSRTGPVPTSNHAR
jgi:hypothetical protein